MEKKEIQDRVKMMVRVLLGLDSDFYGVITNFFSQLERLGNSPREYELVHYLICSTPPDGMKKFDLEGDNSVLAFVEKECSERIFGRPRLDAEARRMLMERGLDLIKAATSALPYTSL